MLRFMLDEHTVAKLHLLPFSPQPRPMSQGRNPSSCPPSSLPQKEKLEFVETIETWVHGGAGQRSEGGWDGAERGVHGQNHGTQGRAPTQWCVLLADSYARAAPVGRCVSARYCTLCAREDAIPNSGHAQTHGEQARCLADRPRYSAPFSRTMPIHPLRAESRVPRPAEGVRCREGALGSEAFHRWLDSWRQARQFNLCTGAYQRV